MTSRDDRENGAAHDQQDKSVGVVGQIRKLFASSGLARLAGPAQAGERVANTAGIDGSRMAPQRLTDGFPRRRSGRLPRIGMFGEFSTGKSSVVNLLLGRDVLPTAVLASTRRPTTARYAPELAIEAVNLDGSRSAVAPDAMEVLAREDISRFDIGIPSELLHYVELLDTAGFADPYQDTRLTLDVANNVDVCIWCTLATQAWRESEQRTWRNLPAQLRASSILAVTHIDNIANGSDLARIEARLRRETGGQFGAIVLLAVPDAMRARGTDDLITDPKLWRISGGLSLLAAMREAVANMPVKTAEKSAAGKPSANRPIAERKSSITASDAAAPPPPLPTALKPPRPPVPAPPAASPPPVPQPPPQPTQPSPPLPAPTLIPRPPAPPSSPTPAPTASSPPSIAPSPAVPPPSAPPPPALTAISPSTPPAATPAPTATSPAAPSPSAPPPPLAQPSSTPELDSGAASASAQLQNLNIRVFLLKVMATVPSCLTAAWVDLRERRVMQYVGTDTQQASETPLGPAIADLFQGQRVQQIEAVFRTARRTEPKDRHYFREIVVMGQDCFSIMIRNPASPDQALVVLTDKAASLGRVLTTVRGLVNASGAELGT